jgi:cation diffusion facilitator CzcD-associated flavoprotein CzcO
MEHFDVVVVGAGISGIGAGYFLQRDCPDRSYVILEGRGQMGGTWDLFRYPGVRSDSDMHTLGYSFKTWTAQKSIADGPSILSYLHETASEFGSDKNIRYKQLVSNASWSSENSQWTVQVKDAASGQASQYTCNFLYMCSGYYSYKSGYTPQFPGIESFTGQVIHPQQWPDSLDYAGKRVVVIGSGATAMTLVPRASVALFCWLT